MHKSEIAHVLRMIAGLLTLKGEPVFRVRAYERAARTVEHGDFDLEALAREGKLIEIPGIGKNLASKIHELVTTGTSAYLQELSKEVPIGLLDVVNVPGIGLSTARRLYETLGVSDLKTLEHAVEARLIQTVPGLGPKREAIIRRGLSEVMKHWDRVLLAQALPVAEHILGLFAKAGVPGAIVGETRRALETVASLDILLEAESNAGLLEKFKTIGLGYFNSQDLWDNAWNGETQAFVLPSNLGVPMKVWVVPQDRFGWKQLHLTGPSSFLGWIQQLAESQGYDVGKDGLTKEGTPVPAAGETHIFEMLGISFIPPELRHMSECWQMARDNRTVEPVKLSDIKGDLHVHSNWSDGLNSIEQMVQKALDLGYSYIAITDHATRIKVINGLDPDKIQAQIQEIQMVSQKYPQIRILSGVEVDILKDGSLALPDDILAKLDIVVASIHQGLDGAGRSIVDRLVKAAANPHVDIIGHPTGRLIGRRPGNQTDLDELFKVAAANNTLLEINASPERLDLSGELAAAARGFGVRFAVSTDAHSTNGMHDMALGIAASARRGGLTSESVVNAQDLEDWFPLKGRSGD